MTAFWQDRPVLVTGATGFLGSWLVPALVERGARPVAFIRSPSPDSMLVRSGWLERIPVVVGDIDDVDLLIRTFTDFDVQTVFHLAAQTQVGVAKMAPLETLEINVRGTWCLLDAARRCSNVQVIASSSDKAYGVSAALPYRESHPMQGTYPYDVSKSCADLISQMYAVTFGTPVAITRCGNIFGGGDTNMGRTVPGVVLSALRNEPFRIRSTGLHVRDFLYVEDAVDGYLLLAEKLGEDETLAGEAFNFSLGFRLTILDLVNKILSLMGKEHIKPVVLNQSSAEILEQFMVSDKAKERLGWTPQVGLEEGLRRTIAWYTEQFEANQPSTTDAIAASDRHGA